MRICWLLGASWYIRADSTPLTNRKPCGCCCGICGIWYGMGNDGWYPLNI